MNSQTPTMAEKLPVVFATFTGLILPSIFLGRAATAVIAGLALCCIPLIADRRRLWGDVRDAVATPVGFLITATAAVWLLGLTESPDVPKSFLTELRSACFIVFSVLIWSLLSISRELIDRCHQAFVIAILVLAAYAIIGMVFAPALISFVRGHGWDPAFSAHIGLKETGSAAGMMIMLAVYLAFRWSGRWRIAASVCALMLLVVCYLTESRAGYAGLLGAGLAIWLTLVAKKRNLRLFAGGLMVGAVVLGLVAIVLVGIKHDRFQFPGEEQALIPYWLIDAPRQGIWEKTLEVSEPYRWTGFGINMINLAPGADDYNEIGGTVYVPAHPHNWVIEILAETGIPGLFMMLLTIAAFTVALIKRYWTSDHGVLLAAIGIWAVYWTSGLFNFSYWSAWWQLSIYTLIAICLAEPRNEDRSDERR